IRGEEQQAATTRDHEEDGDVGRPCELNREMPRNAVSFFRRHLRRDVIVLAEHVGSARHAAGHDDAGEHRRPQSFQVHGPPFPRTFLTRLPNCRVPCRGRVLPIYSASAIAGDAISQEAVLDITRADLEADGMQIRRLGVVGAGTMGGGIAALAVSAGIPVVLLDVPATGPDKSATARGGLERAKKSKPAAFMDVARAAAITIGNTEDDLATLADCDLVVEAIIEQV